VKKFLTILTLALALCLVCGVALAGTDEHMNSYTVAEVKGFVTAGQLPDGTVIYGSDLDTVILATPHNTEAAVKVYTDSGLNYFKLVTVLVDPCTDHPGTWTTTKKDTCIAVGEQETKCKICGATLTRPLDVIKPGDHTIAGGQWEYRTVEEPTCSEEGVARIYCKTCKVWIPDTDAKVEPTHAHAWVDHLISAPTCKALGEWEWACKYCGLNYFKFLTGNAKTWKDLTVADYNANTYFVNEFGPIDGHKWVNWVDNSPATCAKNKTQIRWCSICELKQEREVPNTKLDPVWATVKDPTTIICTDTTVEWYCVLCKGTAHANQTTTVDSLGKALSPDLMTAVKVNHVYDLADETAYELDGSGKIKVYTQALRASKAKCTEGDYKIAYCQLCGAGDKKVYVSEAPGHKWSEWQCVAEPGESGNKDGLWTRTCKVCGDSQNYTGPQQPSSACKAHEWIVDEANSVAATCTEKGVVAYKCANCGIAKEEKEEVAELGHKWKEEVITAATCKEAGKALKTCETCGVMETAEIAKLDHTWDEGKITKEATKEAKGEKTYTCTACGETKTEEVEYVVTAAPKYSVTGLTYDGQTLKGKLAHDEDTLEAKTLNVRVTFFMTGNYYMATIGEVAADGSFSVDGVGPIEYISVVATGSSSVNPDDVVALGSGEITVK